MIHGGIFLRLEIGFFSGFRVGAVAVFKRHLCLTARTNAESIGLLTRISGACLAGRLGRGCAGERADFFGEVPHEPRVVNVAGGDLLWGSFSRSQFRQCGVSGREFRLGGQGFRLGSVWTCRRECVDGLRSITHRRELLSTCVKLCRVAPVSDENHLAASLARIRNPTIDFCTSKVAGVDCLQDSPLGNG